MNYIIGFDLFVCGRGEVGISGFRFACLRLHGRGPLSKI